MSRHHSEDELADALHKSHGCVYLAAQYLGITAQAIHKRKRASPRLMEICHSYKGRLFDTALLQLEIQVRNGNFPAIKQALALAKEYGFMTQEEMRADGCLPPTSEKELDKALLRILRILAAGREGGAIGPNDLLPPGFPPPA